MNNNIEAFIYKAFIYQEKMVIKVMKRQIAEAKRNAKESIKKCENRIKEAQKNLASVK